ncbi:large subunit GTPase 1 homolog [Mercenaria mercenaria]|uniref:large subunit GTPase 1 homolog n=1 Tax=Mercenaria mercenaria TaxID=6596 RepID=UPI00234F2B6C|nr:large subunit GTPase 1 homolog [Mercenaria mercenaria]
MGKKKQGAALGKSIIRDRFGKKDRKSGDTFLHTADLQDGYDWGRLNLQSVTEQNNLDDFLATAELAGTEFTAEKLNVKFISQETGSLPHAEELKTIKGLHKQHEELLRIPRRPPWNARMSVSEVDQNEKVAFLDWRRSLASVQEDERIVMTPYEKNLDFWRQLWRVIERSDIVVQIVDARNPLLFYCPDLEAYVKEVDKSKICMVLINKADFLGKQQREIWADYFTKRGIRVVFWSAVEETARQEQVAKSEKEAENGGDLDSEEEVDNEDEGEKSDSNDVDNDDDFKDDDKSVDDKVKVAENLAETARIEKRIDDIAARSDDCKDILAADVRNKLERNTEYDVDDIRDENEENFDTAANLGSGHNEKDFENVTVDTADQSESVTCTCDKLDKAGSDSITNEPDGHVCSVYRELMKPMEIKNTSLIYTGPELLELFKSIHLTKKVHEGLTTVGMVGYPNVGKSSTINAILKMKKVPVSATPGRTKHFQTLYVDPTLMLCDCPGLVFPSFVTTKADLVLGGILPIDQMRDYISPTALLCQKIPRWLLEKTYGINLPKPVEGEDPHRPPTAHELLNTYGAMRGFMTNRGLPDGPRSSRYLLKDYVNGKLLHCQPPAEMDPVEFNGYSQEPDGTSATGGLSLGNQDGRPILVPSKVDAEFFRKEFSTVHTRTARGEKGAPTGSDTAGSSQSSEMSLNEKPWKRHNNRNKKEKLRRVYGHLDK